MGAKNLNRRDFLKLLGLSSLALVNWQQIDLVNKTSPRRMADKNIPNILIVVFDALSARNMSLYGYPRKTTPNLERIAENATVFYRHYAGGNFTTPGTASLLTGVYPWSHRSINPHGTVQDQYTTSNLFHELVSSYNTFAHTHNPLVTHLLEQFSDDIDNWARLSELSLAAHSYADLYFQEDYNTAYQAEVLLFRNRSGPSSSFFASRFEKLKRYFSAISLNSAYQEQFPRGVPNSDLLYFRVEDVIDWIQSQVDEQSEPFFGYVHLMPPHDPYLTRREFVNRFDDGWQPSPKPEHFFSEKHPDQFLNFQRRLYDEFISYIDAEFGRLFDFMQRSGVLENTCLVFTSDHGEMFERGIWAHITPTLFEPVIQIPLVMWTPGAGQGRNVYTLSSCVDLMPTLLELSGQQAPEGCEGMLLPINDRQVVHADRSIYVVEAKENFSNAPLNKAAIALIKGDYKLVHYLGYDGYLDTYELYDLRNDPEELEDLYSSGISAAADLQDELHQKLDEVNRPYR